MRSTKKYLINLIIAELKDKDEIILNDALRHIMETGRLSRYKSLAHVRKGELYEEFVSEKLLNKALAQETQPVRLIGVGVSSLVEPEKQLDMLNPSVQRLEQLNRAIDRIRQKYGFSAIQTGQTLLLKDLFSTD